MAQREQGRVKDEDQDEDKQPKREPRPSDREREPIEDEDPGKAVTERDPGDDDEDEEGDEPAQGARQELSDEEREARRVRRRTEKREKRERDRREREESRETIRRLTEEVTGLKTRFERGAQEGQLARVDDDIEETKSVIARLRQAKRAAIEEVNPDKIEEVDERLYRARRRLENLEGTKEQLSKRQPERAASTALVDHANRFMREHSWYDPNQVTDDEDSLIVQAIDRRLMRSGTHDPNSTTYWEELRKQVRSHPRLKHRYGGKAAAEDEDEEPAPRRNGGPPVSGRAGGHGRDGFTLTEDHKHALREAGIEPGTERYSKMIDSFKKAHKAQRDQRAA